MTQKAMSRVLLAVAFSLAATNCGETRLSDPPPLNPPPIIPPVEDENQRPSTPEVELTKTSRGYGQFELAVKFVKPSTDAENDLVGYRYRWLKDGAEQSFPAGTSVTTIELTAPDPTDPFAPRTVTEDWIVQVTPLDAYGEGVSASASTRVSLTISCDSSPTVSQGYYFVDCAGEHVFEFSVTGPVSMASQDPGNWLAGRLYEKVVTAPEAGDERFRNFIDLVLKITVDKDPTTPVDYHPTNYNYLPVTSAAAMTMADSLAIGAGGYDPPHLEPMCIDIPLVGRVCFNGYLADIDNELGARFFDYSLNGWVTVEAVPGAADVYDLTLELPLVTHDLLLEPPTDPTLIDCADGATCRGVAYLAENDLSSYVKSYTKADIGEAIIKFRAEVPDTSLASIPIRYHLRSIRLPFYESWAFSPPTTPGPYCTNNAGFTEHRLAGAPYSAAGLRPFDDMGSPNYPGIVSDTNGTTAQQAYYVQQPVGGFPTAGGALSGTYPDYTGGGTGVGRDRIGLGTSPYEYNDADGRWSDNPNNCRFPADACTIAGGADPNQTGSPEFVNTTTDCEYPNVANHSDDATYRFSELITNPGAIYNEILRDAWARQ